MEGTIQAAENTFPGPNSPTANLSSSSVRQIEYFLRKLTEAMGGSWVEERLEDYKLQLSSQQQNLNAWELIRLVGSGHFSKGMDRQTLSMGINEVYLELILDVLKQVGGWVVLGLCGGGGEAGGCDGFKVGKKEKNGTF